MGEETEVPRAKPAAKALEPAKAGSGRPRTARKHAGRSRSAAISAMAKETTKARTQKAASGSSGGLPMSSGAGTVTMQARVDARFARHLLEADAAVLGLGSASELVREGLRLVHRRARELAMAASYDEFYGGGGAPPFGGKDARWGGVGGGPR